MGPRAFVIAGVLAGGFFCSCGSSSPAASGSTGGPSDAGVTDGGSGSDAGGATDGGSAGDGGVGASDCTGLAPGTVAAQTVAGSNTFLPASGTADGNGTVVLEAFWTGGPRALRRILFYSADGALLESEDVPGAFPLEPLADGFAGQVPLRIGSYDALEVWQWSSRGRDLGTGSRHFGSAGYVSDRRGALIFAGPMGDGSPTAPRQQLLRRVELPAGGPPRIAWSSPPASGGAVFGLGVDEGGRILVVTSGASKFGDGAISAQWFDASGAALTGEFLLVAGFQPGASTWFEVQPAIGGGIVVTRVDTDRAAGFLETWRSEHLCIVDAGGTECHDAPDWLRSRRDTSLHVVRQGRAYALASRRRANTDCVQSVEVLAPSGASCGSIDLRAASGQCSLRDVAVGIDGTVVQTPTIDLPGTDRPPWRWWPGVLR
jgi:hypothetical protein